MVKWEYTHWHNQYDQLLETSGVQEKVETAEFLAWYKAKADDCKSDEIIWFYLNWKLWMTV